VFVAVVFLTLVKGESIYAYVTLLAEATLTANPLHTSSDRCLCACLFHPCSVPHAVKGESIYAYVTLLDDATPTAKLHTPSDCCLSAHVCCLMLLQRASCC
jgi:hypothetical protein